MVMFCIDVNALNLQKFEAEKIPNRIVEIKPLDEDRFINQIVYEHYNWTDDEILYVEDIVNLTIPDNVIKSLKNEGYKIYLINDYITSSNGDDICIAQINYQNKTILVKNDEDVHINLMHEIAHYIDYKANNFNNRTSNSSLYVDIRKALSENNYEFHCEKSCNTEYTLSSNSETYAELYAMYMGNFSGHIDLINNILEKEGINIDLKESFERDMSFIKGYDFYALTSYVVGHNNFISPRW